MKSSIRGFGRLCVRQKRFAVLVSLVLV